MIEIYRQIVNTGHTDGRRQNIAQIESAFACLVAITDWPSRPEIRGLAQNGRLRWTLGPHSRSSLSIPDPDVHIGTIDIIHRNSSFAKYDPEDHHHGQEDD